MRKRIALFCALLALLLPAAALAESAGKNLLYNGDFSVHADTAALPSGWAFAAYDAAESAAKTNVDEDGVFVTIYNDAATDARISQTIDAAPDTCYLIAALVKTEDVAGGTGASLSIDNYSIDGTYCYSENLHGTNDWRRVEMYVLTGPEQTQLCVALRLGGYGTTARGRASFRDVIVYQTDAPEGADVIKLATENGSISGTSDDGGAFAAADSKEGYFGMVLAVCLLGAGLYTLLYRRSLRYERAAYTSSLSPRGTLIALLAGAFVARTILSLLFFGHSTDINCFMAWGNAMRSLGARGFYTSGMFADYPPAYMYVCGFLSWLCNLLNIPYGSDAMALVFKLPATLADLGSAYFLYRIAKRAGVSETFSLMLAALLAFNPVTMFVSGAWGQIDTVLGLLLVLTCWLFLEDRKILAGAVYGLAILLKPQALMLGPLLAAAYIVEIPGAGWGKRLGKTCLAVLAAFAALFVLSLPCMGTQKWYWLAEKYVSTASSYPYASIEAFNLFALFGGNWRPVASTMLGVPYYVWGTIGILLSVAAACTLYYKGRGRSRGALYLTGALMIIMIFTLGHYMHERYLVPALMLLLAAYAYYRDRRILLAFGGISLPALVNVLSAMYIVDHQSARGGLYEGITRGAAFLEVAACFFLLVVCIDILWKGRVLAPLDAPKRAPRALPDLTRDASGSGALPGSYDAKLHYKKRDFVYIGVLTLAFAVLTLTNLGTLRAPQTFWQTDTLGSSVTIAFDEPRHIAEYRVYGNIADGGVLLLDTGETQETFTQTYDEMFRWACTDADFVADRVTLSLYSGGLKLNEVAFFDADGALVPCRVVDADQADGGNLVDEQDTVPEIPSYYNGMYFDELYHGRTAYEHLNNLAPYENSHPPLGKLFIMLGVLVFGMCPFGWRVVGALFGVAMLPVLYAFGKRIFRGSSEYALTLTTLFALDFMHFTQTRIATIDVYAVFFILLMYYYMYQYLCMNFFVDGLHKTLKPLALAGLFFGLGAACKWTCIYAGAGLAILLLCSLTARYLEYVRIQRDGTKADRERVKGFWTLTGKTLLWCCLFYVAIPFAIYFASYTPYFIYEAGQSASSAYGIGDMFRTFGRYQEFMYSYHSGLNATHPYQSSWYAWPFTIKPMWYYFNSYAGGKFVSTISASGNPAIWWVSTLGAVALLIERIGKRIAPDNALKIFCVGILANYLPWVLVTRCTFIYHFFATVPFLLMATVYLLWKFEQRYMEAKYVKWVWIGIAALFFILLYPGLSGYAVSPQWASFLKNLPGGKLMYGA